MDSIFRDGIERLLAYKRGRKRFSDWFVLQELKAEARETLSARGLDPDSPAGQAEILLRCAERLPLSIPEGSALAGSMDSAFSPSYALINPSFKVESFAGYCDPMAVYDDISPEDGIAPERIEKVKRHFAASPYVKRLGAVYAEAGDAVKEVVFFVEPVTGHVIPDFRAALKLGSEKLKRSAPDAGPSSAAMKRALDAAPVLAARYALLAAELGSRRQGDSAECARLSRIEESCLRVPKRGARSLHEAMQAYVLLWQLLCMEQAPNPYAFSAGNLDRVFQAYLKGTPFEEAVELSRHLLAFFMVGARCWAISQNILVGGRDADGRDLSCAMSYALLEAFRRSNCPQPALSLKIHSGTPERLRRALGGFLFEPGHSTPSLFNDEALFKLLAAKGVAKEDLADCAIAGCQEPLVTGKESSNTTNSWLNLAKVLELALNDGRSLLSERKLGLSWKELGFVGADDAFRNLDIAFERQLAYATSGMERAANACVEALGSVAAPFSSAFMGCLETGRDLRDAKSPGVKYSGSGCLIHGLSVVSDSLVAVERLLASGLWSAEELLAALRSGFEGCERLHAFLCAQPKYGNDDSAADAKAVEVAKLACAKTSALRNPAGKPFLPDFSTPSTHLLYGYWVGATPDGRRPRRMLGYGVDPRPGLAANGLQSRVLSCQKLPFELFKGGYASHLGLSPEDYGSERSQEAKAEALWRRVVAPLFKLGSASDRVAPFYVYFNVDDTSRLKRVLESPAEYAPGGVYIMRIHGTFVNFLDLSPAIQNDIMLRLENRAEA